MLKTLKKLASFVGEYKINSILSPLLVLLEVIMECFIPAIAGELITFIQSPSKLDDLIFTKPIITAMQKSVGYDNIIPIIAVLCGILVVLALLSLMFGAFAGIHCSRASCGFAKNLRRGLYEKSQDFSFENIDKFSTSSLVTRLTTDVTNVQQSFMMIIRTAIRSPFMFVFSIIMAFVVGGKMAWIFVVVVPILAFTLIMVAKKAMPIFRKVFKKYDKLNGSIQENVAGMRVVKSFVREDYENEKFNIASDDVRADFTKAEKILAFNAPIMQFCMYFLMVGILLVGSNLLISSGGRAFDVGNFSTLLAYGMQILMSLMMVSMIFVMTTMSFESAKRICEIIDEEPTITNPKNPVSEVKNGDIVFENVSFKYSQKAEKFALSNINLEIKSGQTVGIIGGTGSSKSTLIQLIPRLYDVTSGKVLVGGIDVRSYDIVTLRDSVAIVLQKNVLFSGTIKENLRWGNENATDDELVRACQLSCADEFIQSFPEKYDTYIEQGGSNVSGGQKQRLCIARALLKKPKILILDDSTSAVDTATEAKIRETFRGSLKDSTKIIIAQRIMSVMDSDMIVVMNDGRITGVGTHGELMQSNTEYQEIYASQMESKEKEA